MSKTTELNVQDQDELVRAIDRVSHGYFHRKLPGSDPVSQALNRLMNAMAENMEQSQANTLQLCQKNDEAHVLNLELERKLDIIQKQREAILELSTPVLEVWDGILVMPLVGTVDTQRAQQIMEDLLESVAKGQAAVVIIDITGVPVIDTQVGDHLLKTMEAAKMLGAEVILTGMSPTNAQTVVKLGMDLDRVNAKSTLKAGLNQALRMSSTTQGAP
jgi:anti-anti-sigma regulatory factor